MNNKNNKDNNLNVYSIFGSGIIGIGLASIAYSFFNEKQRQKSEGLIAKELKKLRKQNDELIKENRRLSRLMNFKESTSFDNEAELAELTMTPSEIETVRALFETFDYNGDGCIEVLHLRTLYKKLGEPITDEEAEEFMKQLGGEKGYVDFQQFLHWWWLNHKGDRKHDKYTSRFKFIHEKLATDSFDPSRVTATPVGHENTTEFRYVFHYKKANGALKQISPWHDIPLTYIGQSLDAKIFHFICEIPRWTRKKYEVSTNEPFNPIKQDVKNGKLRFYKHGDVQFNYGCLPQTWEDPNWVNPETKHPGDCDPIDAIEIGTRQLEVGSVTRVKILGVFALIDSGETDWKVICINIADPLAQKLNDVDDIDKHMPGCIHAIREYFRVYKVCTGLPENEYAMRGECCMRDYAIKVVEECHQQWNQLMERGTKEV